MPAVPPLVVVVDDDESVRRATARLLRTAGFDVETFTWGAAFLASPGSRRPHCLVLDLQMAGVSGLDVLARLRSSGRRLPAVVVSSLDTPESRREVADAGAIALLPKPFEAKALLDAVAAAVGDTPIVHQRRPRAPWPMPADEYVAVIR